MAYSISSHANFAAAMGTHRSPLWRRPAVPMAFYAVDEVVIIDSCPIPPAPSPYYGRRTRPARSFHEEVMIIEARPVSSAPTKVHSLSKKEISQLLETSIYGEEEKAAAGGGGDREVCAVCQETYREKQRVGVLRCRHRFHAQCIGKWLEIKNVCPLCNAVGFVRN